MNALFLTLAISCSPKSLKPRIAFDSQFVEVSNYSIDISIEYYRKFELLTVYRKDSMLYCRAVVVSSVHDQRMDTLFMLKRNDMPAFRNFEEMVRKDSINSNVPLISGRLGIYKYANESSSDSLESKSLYSLVKALGLRRKGI